MENIDVKEFMNNSRSMTDRQLLNEVNETKDLLLLELLGIEHGRRVAEKITNYINS